MKRLRHLSMVSCVVILMLVSTGAVWAAEAVKVNINTAPTEELMTLQGVGESIAGRIIEYREKNGPFEKPEDIMKVKGIGQKTFDANKMRIVVE